MVKIPKKTDVDMCVASSPGEARYPYGTELCFRDDLVDQLGIGDLEVDQVVTITAVALVSGKSERSSAASGGEPVNEKSVDLQITELMVSGPGQASPTDILYGKS